jgi:LmbE family N-acetylglucosaminyl deacetylase
MHRFVLLVVLIALGVAGAGLPAQLRPQPVAELPGEATLQLLLRRLASTGTFMQATAHPDDEDNALLAMFGIGQGMRTVLVSATRGDGGQNEIGPELFQALGVLRTEELLAAHRFDGAEQFFTRAVDFGYSFSVDESIERWGGEEIAGDYTRLIRAIRPDVVAGFLCGGGGGGQHHQASTRLTAEAVRAAADPAKYPEQIKEGLRPWRVRRMFCTEGFGAGSQKGATPAAGLLMVDTAGFDPVIGRTYSEVGLEARSMHKCQGMPQLLLLPGASTSRTYRSLDVFGAEGTMAPASMFEGIDTRLEGLTRFAPSSGAVLAPALAAIAGHVEAARAALATSGQYAAVAPLAAGLRAARALRSRIAASDADREELFDVDFRLARKEREFEQALVVAAGIRLEALATDGLVIREQAVPVRAYVSNQAPDPLTVRGITFAPGSTAAAACAGSVAQGRGFSCDSSVVVPADAPYSTPYWTPRRDAARYDFEPDVPFGVPFAPTPFRAAFDLTIGGAELTVDRAIEFRYDNILAGEKRMELQVVPAFALTVTPGIAVVPAAAAASRRIEVTVINHQPGKAAAGVSLEIPPGWRTEPQKASVTFSREDEQATIAFTLMPPSGVRAGDYRAAATARSPAVESSLGYEVVEYPHVRRRHVVQPAETRVKVVDVTVRRGLRVGYVMGVGDQVPAAIEQLGAELHVIGASELASGDLSRYHTIVTGVRAYERRADLRANNQRLLDYVAEGGTLLVQYNKFEFNEAPYAPYPAKVSSGRVTDEGSPIEILVPDHPVFNTPNRVDSRTWQGWVQERGLYFLGERDPRYVDLIRLEDPFPLNSGPRTGALVEARYGKGRWIYVGLGLWRQLPAGTDGAYQLMANLVSLGSAR